MGNLFNALDDGFCMMEPHWYEKAIHGNDVDFMTWWMKAQTSIHLAGYKETYRIGHEMCDDLIERHTPDTDFFIVVFRDPVYVHSSQRALGWTEWDEPEYFNESYRVLDKFIEKWPGKAIPVVYEDFVVDPLAYLNKRLPFRIEGELKLALTGYTFGDPFANRSTRIQVSRRKVCISSKEIEEHAHGRSIWSKYR